MTLIAGRPITHLIYREYVVRGLSIVRIATTGAIHETIVWIRSKEKS